MANQGDNRMLVTAVLTAALIVFITSCNGFFVDPKPVSMTVTPPAPSLLTGAKQQFLASCTYDDGKTGAVKDVAWTTSNAAVIYINDSGMATAVKEGSASISATYKGISGSTTVSVVVSPLNSLRVTPSNPVITVNQATQQFAATGSFADGVERDITASVQWTSSDTSIATISSTGLATAVGTAGTTTIKAASGNISDSTTLTVRQAGSGSGSGN